MAKPLALIIHSTDAPWTGISKLAEARDCSVHVSRSVEEAERFFRDLCTLRELESMSQRWQVVQLLDQGLPYHEVSRRTGASTTTVTRVAQWLRRGEGGYRLALDRCSVEARGA